MSSFFLFLFYLFLRQLHGLAVYFHPHLTGQEVRPAVQVCLSSFFFFFFFLHEYAMPYRYYCMSSFFFFFFYLHEYAPPYRYYVIFFLFLLFLHEYALPCK